MSQSRQLAAIMFTDIVGYTAMMGEDEEKAFELLERNRLVQRPVIEKYNGRWLKEMGDGVLASFTTVSDAVYCAKSIQEACLEEDDLKLRIGIHLGEVVFQGDDVFGDGVNIASRLEPLAPIGGILVSESVNRDLGNKKGIETHFVGEESLKNVKDPIRVYSVKVEGAEVPEPAESAAAVAEESKSVSRTKLGLTSLAIIIVLVLAYFFYSQQKPQPVPVEVMAKTIAVLPFKDDSQQGDNQYFCDGMMDEILNHLQRIKDLGVKSRTAVEPYRNTTQGLDSIARQLDVAFILEGGVRKYGDRFRLTAQLIAVESGNHLWAETYDGIISDTIFTVQSHIAKRIAASLNAAITPEEEQRIDKVPTTDMAAYDNVIRARHEMSLYWNTLDKKHIREAQSLYDKALRIDPEYVDAIRGKGGTFGPGALRNPDSAIAYAERALVLDSESARACTHMAGLYSATGKIDLAIENYLKAIELDPDGLWPYLALGLVYKDQKHDLLKALPYLRKGLGMGAILTTVNTSLGWAYLNIGDYERSRTYFSKAMEECHDFLGHALWLMQQGKFREVIQFSDSIFQSRDCEKQRLGQLFRGSFYLGEFEKAEEYYNQWQNAGPEFEFFEIVINIEMGYVYSKLGKTEEASRIFAEQIQKLQPRIEEGESFPKKLAYLGRARIYAFQGQREKALENLDEFAKRGFIWGWHNFIEIDPFFESLRNDPEFKAIVKRAQEEKAALRVQVREMEESGELEL